PYSYILAFEGIAIGVAWIARRRRAWDPGAATRIFSAAAVGFAVLWAVTGALVVHRVWSGRAHRGRRRPLRPRHVDRCLRDQVLVRPWWRRPRQRPPRDHRTGRARIRR